MSDQDRLGPPPIEPMTNAAWSRVERGLFERLDQPAPRPLPAPRSRWPWLAVPAFALASAAVIVIVLSLRSTPTTDVATAPIVPSRVVAGDTPSMVSYGDAHLTLEAHAAIVMARENNSPSVLVERGAVDFTVAPRQNEPYVVRAGDVVVRVVGTQFRVARYEERVTIAVERGLVDVQFRGDVHRLSAGQSWSSQEQTASTTRTKDEPASIDDTPAPNTKPVVGSNGKPVASNDKPVVSNDKPVVSNDKPVVSNDKPVVSNEKPVVSNDKPAVVSNEKPVVSNDKPSSSNDPSPEKAKFELMSSLERRDPERAMKGYLELSKGNSEWSANALFAAGRLAFDRKDKRAKTFLELYLKRFPRSVNAEDARDLLTRLDGDNP